MDKAKEEPILILDQYQTGVYESKGQKIAVLTLRTGNKFYRFAIFDAHIKTLGDEVNKLSELFKK